MDDAHVSLEQVVEAAERIAPYVRRTPALRLRPTYDRTVPELWVKLEGLQHTGSFKPRGAFNAMLSLSEEARSNGVAAVSGGNHGLGVAFAAKTLGLKATLFLPVYASPGKQERIAALGAEVRLSETIAECFDRAAEYVAGCGAAYIHPYADPLVVAGQGTVGLEFFRDTGDLDTVLVAVGGGGLISGVAVVAAALRPGVRVIGVEPEGAPTMQRALTEGAPVALDRIESVAADSLGAPTASPLTLALVQRHVHDVILVPDDAITAAQQWLWREVNVLAEPGGATALAAYLSGAVQNTGRTGVIICGGNAGIAI